MNNKPRNNNIPKNDIKISFYQGSCLLKILSANDNLKELYNNSAKTNKITYMNIFSENIEAKIKKKMRWVSFVKITKYIFLLILFTAIVSAGGFHVIGGLVDNISNVQDTLIGVSERVTDLHDTVASATELYEMRGGNKKTIKRKTKNNKKNNKTKKRKYKSKKQHGGNKINISGMKQTMIYVYTKLEQYDLMIEIYRTNFVIIKKMIDTKMERGTNEYKLAEKMYNITEKLMFELITKAYKCFGITINMDERNVNDFLNITDNTKIFNMEVSGTEKEYINALYMMLTEFEELEDSISPILIELNSYITRLNILFDMTNCKIIDNIKINNTKPLFTSLFGKILMNLNVFNEKNRKDIIRQYEPSHLVSEKQIRQITSIMRQMLCRTSKNIDELSFCKPVIIAGEEVGTTLVESDISNIYKYMSRDTYIRSALERLDSDSKAQICGLFNEQNGNNPCKTDYKKFISDLFTQIEQNYTNDETG